MLCTKDRDKFILKHIDTCSAVELFRHHEYYYYTFWDTNCPQKTSLFGDFLRYLKRYLMKYKPEVGFAALCKDMGTTLTKEEIEDAYIDYMVKVAAAEEFFDDYLLAAFFARKALDMVNYFHPYLNRASKEKIWQERKWYKSAMAIYEDYKDYLTDEFYNAVTFDWEDEFYSPSTHANKNFKGLVLV
jgi:hypothetical protein